MTPTSTSLSRTEALSLLALTAACVAILANTLQGDGEPLIASLALSGLAFAACFALIRWLGPTFIKAGLKGVDMSKHHRKEIPECMGGVCAIVYILVVIVFIPFPFYKDIVAATSGGGNKDVVLQVEHVQQGRFLHRFPLSKVSWCCRSRASPGRLTLSGCSSHRTFRPSSRSSRSRCSASATTCSTSAGGTSFSYPPSLRSRSSSSTLSISASRPL